MLETRTNWRRKLPYIKKIKLGTMEITICNTSNSESLNYTNLIIHCLGRLTEKKKRKGE